MAKKHMVKVYSADDLPFSRGTTASTSVYAAQGTPIKPEQVSMIAKLVKSLGQAVRGYEIDSFQFGFFPFVVKIKPKKK